MLAPDPLFPVSLHKPAHGIWASLPSHSFSETSEPCWDFAAPRCHEAFLGRCPHALRAWCEPAGALQGSCIPTPLILQPGVPWPGHGEPGSRVCLRRNPLPALSRCSALLACSPTGSPTLTLEGLERWVSVRNPGRLPSFQARAGLAWVKRATTFDHNSGTAEADALKEHSAGVGRELWVNVYRAENWTWRDLAPLLVWAYWEGPGCPNPFPTLGTF